MRVSLPDDVEDIFTAGFGAPLEHGFKLQMHWGQIQGFVNTKLQKVKRSDINVARIDADPGESGSAVLDYTGMLIGIVYARSVSEVTDTGHMSSYGYGKHAVFLFNNDAIVSFANTNGLKINVWGKGTRKSPVFILGHLQEITGLVVCRERQTEARPE